MVETNSINDFKAKEYVLGTNEEYMSQKQLSYFKDELMKWKGQLLDKAGKTLSYLQDASRLADPNDRASQEEEVNFELRARDRELKLIKKIDQTMEKIDNKNYGYCEECGEEIGFKRLQARPTATMCIDCKTIAEMKEKHQAE